MPYFSYTEAHLEICQRSKMEVFSEKDLRWRFLAKNVNPKYLHVKESFSVFPFFLLKLYYRCFPGS